MGNRVESRLPEYDEVRERLVDDFNRLRRQRARDALYESLAGRYEVVVGGETLR